MFANSPGPHSAARRRGIVLVLVLGMLGLMALIGVTFATFAGQSLKGGRNFSQGVGRPQPEALMDYALAQLINDTNNPISALRGHSLLRDMYGIDSVFRGSNPAGNSVADTGGLIQSVYDPTVGTYTTLHFVGTSQLQTVSDPTSPFYNQMQYQTNIPTTGPYRGYDFTRWIIRFGGQSTQTPATTTAFNVSTVGQTFEVLADNATGTHHAFTLSANNGNPGPDQFFSDNPLSSSDMRSLIYLDPNLGAATTSAAIPAYNKNFAVTSREYGGTYNNNSATSSNAFVLDGRYMRAFNGAGMTRPSVQVTNGTSTVFAPAYPYNAAAYGNMRIIGSDPAVQQANANPNLYPGLFGLGNPDAVGMDEDYDACDLENWFLAIQSADGQVMIPSFHRPGILTAQDWTYPAYDNSGNVINAPNRSKILRPRQIDNSPLFPYDPSTLDSSGKLTYDIDNDGDGVTDSVWLDLGYPVQRNTNGKTYKPLFAFMVLGLNGRLPLNTVGNLQARAIGDRTNNVGDAVPFPSTSGQVPYSGVYTDNGNHQHQWSSQVFYDTPLYDHTSHLGYSVNEINPKFALQNAPSNLYSADPYSKTTFTQYDDAGINVALTQLRNILAGTRPTTLSNPFTGTLPANMSVAVSTTLNTDVNAVLVNSQPWIFPNGVFDYHDVGGTTAPVTSNTVPAVAGRWGEVEGIPSLLFSPTTSNTFDTTYPISVWNNPVRAGRSIYTTLNTGTGGGAPTTLNPTDGTDDDFDSLDPFIPNQYADPSNTANQFTIIENVGASYPYTTLPLTPGGTVTYPGPAFYRNFPEDLDAFDAAGQMAVASERMRRFVTPTDPAGVGRKVAFLPTTTNEQTRPANDHDFGKGSDDRGRVGFFRYFRPAGMPQEVVYPYGDSTAGLFPYPYTTNSGAGQRYLMPLLLPAGRSNANVVGPVSTTDVSNNKYNGLQAMMTPQIVSTGAYQMSAQMIATLGASPFDWDPAFATTPYGYNDYNLGGGTKLHLFSPTIDPRPLYLKSSVNTSNGPNLGALGDTMGAYPIPYGAPYMGLAVNAYLTPGSTTTTLVNIEQALGAPVVNGYLDGSLNKDEADEMNVYTTNSFDQAYGPTDLEWLYRKHDVDGATLNSRLSQLAPISFTNPADGLTRRRLFSTDAFDLINFSYANDNPIPYAGTLGTNVNHSPDHDFTYNSRFGPHASPSFELMNQVVSVHPTDPQFIQFANPYTTEFLPNPTLPLHTYFSGATGNGDSYSTFVPNNAYSANSGTSATPPIALPQALDTASTTNQFTNWFTNAQVAQYTNLIVPTGGVGTSGSTTYPLSTAQVQTPTVAHRDRKINLNFPLPISNDPAEPIRQKWCRETYQFLKAILPPASVDTPEELAALSQFVVNIIDFRDTDCTMTRFVNTDLAVTDVLTKNASPSQHTAPFDPTWTVSPAGVKFATNQYLLPTGIPGGSYPYDPSLYNPNFSPTCDYLVQHGMENSPVALNEAMAYQAEYATSAADNTTITPYHAMFIELVNTLTESQNNPGSRNNSSAIDLSGWDLVVVPDNYGWGRPDPISGDINPQVVPVYAANPSGSQVFTPDISAWVNQSAQPNNDWNQLHTAVSRYMFSGVATVGGATTNQSIITAMNSYNYNPFIVGTYRTGPNKSPTIVADGRSIEGTNAVAPRPQINIQLPPTFVVPVAAKNQGVFYWVYLRRPANPFDTDYPTQRRPNKEMVVVDALRFPVISASDATFTNAPSPTAAPPSVTKSVNTIYSAQRLQPYRGGHLIPVNSDPNAPTGTINPTDPANPITTPLTSLPTMGPAAHVVSVCPPSPPYAYGYSEQSATPPTGNGAGSVISVAAGVATYTALTQTIRQSINDPTPDSQRDANWSHIPFHDRDFTSLAELLLVPSCPPGLFTKQFVEEVYPGNVFADTASAHTTYAVGTDNARGFAYYNTTAHLANSARPLASATNTYTINVPDSGFNPSLAGRQNFAFPATNLPATPTFPYLTDNFYYTAASVAPPPAGTLAAGQTHLTTEIGGWTGAGWHKMMEFFEVPSSANGAIGTADVGSNYDWYRADTKPGQLNLNLIIDEEVFAGLIDDPRLNENLAVTTAGTYIPWVVSQVDGNGYPTNDTTTGFITGRYPMFPTTSQSVNIVSLSGVPTPVTAPVGRGYVYRDPNVADYPAASAPTYNYQQVHGLKAAFSDFLKLRHGGSGYLFAYGGGDVGMGDFTPFLSLPLNPSTQPVAAERPYRSLSYPDINYTIMRPASLPPSPYITNTISPGTNPPLPTLLESLGTYTSSPTQPYVQLNPALAPMNDTPTPYSYVYDPGVKNPYLAVQFVNPTSPTQAQPTADPFLSGRRLAPPYDATQQTIDPPLGGANPTIEPIAAPFPPPIPPTPARRLFQIPDNTAASNASLTGSKNATAAYSYQQYPVNQPVATPMLSTGISSPPSLVAPVRAVFAADNYTPQSADPAVSVQANNFLGAGSVGMMTTGDDYRQHPAHRTEWLQKITNLTTVRTHQFATWITVGFFEVIKTGTPELGIPDVLGQEIGLAAGNNVRYRSFFVIDRTKATGFNPYYPGDFNACVTYRRRIE